MARVVIDEHAILEAIHDGTMTWLMSKAHEAAAIAAQGVPHFSGAWAGGITVKAGKWAVWVVNTDPAAVHKELGARHGRNPKFRAMYKALERIREA